MCVKVFEWSLNGGLKYTNSNQKENALESFVYLDYASNVDTRKFLPSFAFTLFGTTIIGRKVNNHWLCYLLLKRSIFLFRRG